MHSRPYFYEEFSTQGYGLKANIIQAQLRYSQIREKRSFVFRAGELSSAFGSFLLRYDDAVNPLIDMPLSYGYYEAGVTTGGLTGAQVDAIPGEAGYAPAAGEVPSPDKSAQHLSITANTANWTGGIGYTLAQGTSRGSLRLSRPLSRPSARSTISRGISAAGSTGSRLRPGCVQWGRGPWNAYAELQEFQFAYNVIPTFRENTGYVELRRVLRPRQGMWGYTVILSPVQFCACLASVRNGNRISSQSYAANQDRLRDSARSIHPWRSHGKSSSASNW